MHLPVQKGRDTSAQSLPWRAGVRTSVRAVLRCAASAECATAYPRCAVAKAGVGGAWSRIREAFSRCCCCPASVQAGASPGLPAGSRTDLATQPLSHPALLLRGSCRYLAGAQGGAGRAAQGRPLHQGHGIRRRGLAHRPVGRKGARRGRNHARQMQLSADSGSACHELVRAGRHFPLHHRSACSTFTGSPTRSLPLMSCGQ